MLDYVVKVLDCLRPKGLKVIGYLAMVRNSIGPEGYTCDEIVTARSSKRIRIINTDAEGRLAMLDPLCVLVEKVSGAFLLSRGVQFPLFSGVDRDESTSVHCGHIDWTRIHGRGRRIQHRHGQWTCVERRLLFQVAQRLRTHWRHH